MVSLETGSIPVERSVYAREIVDFLKLGDVPTAEEIQDKLKLNEKPVPWWLTGIKQSLSDSELNQPVDLETKLRADLEVNPGEDYLTWPIIYTVITAGGVIAENDKGEIVLDTAVPDVPPYREMVDAAIKLLEEIGFEPPRQINPDARAMPESSSGSDFFPTFFPDIKVKIERDVTDGKAERVSLVVYGKG